MDFKVHPDAAKNFDQKAEILVSQLIPDPYIQQARPKRSSKPEIVVHEVSPVSVLTTGYSDHFGNETAKTFESQSGFVGLFEESYKNLVRLAEAIHKNKSIHDKISIELLTSLIFEWVEQRYMQTATQSMTEYVLAECEKRLREIEIWLPVAMLNIQSSFELGNITLKPITKNMLDNWFQHIRSQTPDFRPEHEARFNEWRDKFQGYAAATINVFAEPARASEVALEEAERALAMLRFFAPANRIPEVTSYCTLSGKLLLEGVEQFEIQNGEIAGFSDYCVDNASPYWALSNTHIREYYAAGLSVLSELLKNDDRNEYENSLLDSLTLYSKCALARNPADKLISILVALESFLLKDSNESIQQNLAERMAFLFQASAEERKQMKATVLKAYSLRSSFIHHGRDIGIDQLELLREFMMAAWTSFYALIRFIKTYSTKTELFDKLEELKLS